MKETVRPTLRSEMADSATTGMEKGEVFKNCFASVFTSKKCSHTTQFTKSKGRDRVKIKLKPPQKHQYTEICGT